MAIAKRKKKFFDVEIPLINKITQLQAYELKELDKKFIKYDLTRILRGKNMMLQLRVVVDEDKATTTPKGIRLIPSSLRRMIRKGTNYIEDSFSTNCKDAQIRIKPFLIARKKVSRAVRKTLRQEAKNWLGDYVKNKPHKDVFSDIIGNRLQKPLSLKLKKIYPLALCEIRMLKIEKLKEQEKLKVTLEKVKKKEEKVEETKKAEEKPKEKVEKAEEKPKEENKEEEKKK